MTPLWIAVGAALGLVWTVVALCGAIVLGLGIRTAERRRPRPGALTVEPAAPVHLEAYREWLDDGDPSAIRPPAVPPRLDVRL